MQNQQYLRSQAQQQQTYALGVMPPPSSCPREDETVKLESGESKQATNCRIQKGSLVGSVTVREEFGRAEPGEIVTLEDEDDFYPFPPVYRFTAGPEGATFVLEFAPGLQKKGGPFPEDGHKRY